MAGETDTISDLYECHALFPVIFSGDSFAALGVLSHTWCTTSPLLNIWVVFLQISVQLSPLHPLPPGSPAAPKLPRRSVPSLQCRVHQAPAWIPLSCSAAGNFPGRKHSQRQGFLALLPISQGHCPSLPDIQCLEKHFTAFCSFPLERWVWPLLLHLSWTQIFLTCTVLTKYVSPYSFLPLGSFV